MNDIIELRIPSKLEYISIIRLTASSIANSMKLNIDEIEDIKVCISEACINVLNFSSAEEINIQFELKDEEISISINNVLENIRENNENEKQGKMGLLIIKSLMDKVKFEDDKITMIKYI